MYASLNNIIVYKKLDAMYRVLKIWTFKYVVMLTKPNNISTENCSNN